MPEVSVEINGRKYRMACEEGQQEHLRALAARFNAQVDAFKGSFGEIGDTRLTVMAGIAVLDELLEAERQIDALRDELNRIASAGQEVSREAEQMEERYARKLNEVARRLEMATSAIDRAGKGETG